jgi:hypothetical protein
MMIEIDRSQFIVIPLFYPINKTCLVLENFFRLPSYSISRFVNIEMGFEQLLKLHPIQEYLGNKPDGPRLKCSISLFWPIILRENKNEKIGINCFE